MIILLTGSSASGKSSVGKLLSEKLGFQLIDGDHVIKELGLKSRSWNKIHAGIRSTATNLHIQTNVIISHVVLPNTFTEYRQFFLAEKIEFNIVLLKPSLSSLISRSQDRTCHPKPTPVSVIECFFAEFEKFDEKEGDVLVIDNSKQNEVVTVELICQEFNLLPIPK